MGDFDEAIRTDRDLLRTILVLQREHYMTWSVWPTVTEIRAQLGLSVGGESEIHVQLGLPKEPR